MTDRDFIAADLMAPGQSCGDLKEQVSVARLSREGLPPFVGNSKRRKAARVEEYEIGIGRWKATIIKQVDGAGRTGFTARFIGDRPSSWKPKRRQRSFTTRGGWRQQPT